MVERFNKSCQDSHKMSVATEAREMVAAIAGPRGWQDTRESWLSKAARRLGFSYPRTRSIFYERARVISAEEWITLNKKLADLTSAATARQGEIDALQALSRTADAVAFDRAGPLGMAGDATGKAGFRTKR